MPRTKAFVKEEVLKKAMDIFWKQGYHATSYADLVAHLGINRQSIYDTFGDKQQLYNAALEHFRCVSLSGLRESIVNDSPANQIIRQILENTVLNNLKEPEKGCFMVNSTVELACTDKQISSLVTANMEDFVAFLEPIMSRGQQEGSLNNQHSPHAQALFIFNIINGLKVLSKMEVPKNVYDQIVTITRSAIENR